jgi:NDP-sugar pyrophosphorylase family protein
VETSAVVDRSVLLPGARVGVGARVVGSIVGHDVDVGERCELAPLTVVGDGESLSAGTRLANARVPAQVASP